MADLQQMVDRRAASVASIFRSNPTQTLAGSCIEASGAFAKDMHAASVRITKKNLVAYASAVRNAAAWLLDLPHHACPSPQACSICRPMEA